MRFVRRLLSTCTLALCLPCGQADAQDSQVFRVTVNEAISLHSPGDALISHDRTNSDQVFPEQSWIAYTTNMNGATVDLTFGKFIHENFAFFRRNARVDLRVINSDPLANWVTTVSSAQTTGFFGNTLVAVSAESFGSGAGELGLTVSFLEFNPNFLAAGNYTMIVFGQITNK
jgi:hypothetical protein